MLHYVMIRVTNLLQDRKGISSLEYAIMATAIIAAVATAATNLSTEIGALFNSLIASLKNG